MTEIVGGLRARLLRDSLFHTVESGLGELGWFDADRRHAPVRLIAKPAHWDETVEANTMAMEVETVEMQDLEMGSGLTQDDIAVVFDFLAENDSVGVDIANDIRDLLRGRLDVGPQRPVFDLNDYRRTTPVKIGYAVVDEVRIERPSALVQQNWRRHWFQIRCVVRDAYTDDLTGDIDELLDAIYSEAGLVLISETGVAIVRES